METVCKVVDSNVNSQINYTQAVDILNAGEVVAFPTETVYGLEQLPQMIWQLKRYLKQKVDLQIIL